MADGILRASTTNIVDLFQSLGIHARSTEDEAKVTDATIDGRCDVYSGTAHMEGVVTTTFTSTYNDAEIIGWFEEVQGEQGQPIKWIFNQGCVFDGEIKSVTPHYEIEDSGWSQELLFQPTRNWIEKGVYDRFQESLGYSEYTGSSLTFNFKVFATREDAIAYAQSGDLSGQVFGYTPPTDYGKQLYIHETRYEIVNNVKTKISEVFTEYQTLGNKPMVLVRGNYPNDNNLMLRYEGARVNKHNKLTDTWEYASTSLGQIYYHDTDTINYNEAPSIVVVLRTNIPIVGSLEDYNHYVDTGDNSVIENLEDTYTNLTGDELNDTEINTTTCTSPFVRAYFITTDTMNDLKAWLYQDNTATLLKATVWGDKPVEMVVDFIWTPLDMSQFALSVSTSPIMFANNSATKEVGASTYLITADSTTDCYGVDVTLFDDMIIGTYNDWRDYECSYKLYLPLYGVIDLDARNVVNHKLTIKSNYFYTSKVLKHYILIDNILHKEVEVAHGCTIALTSSDQVGKANELISGVGNVVGGTISAISGASLGMPGNVVGGVMGIAQGVMSIAKDVSHDLWGNNTATANVNDIMYSYLIIECPTYIVPSNLHTVYNYPSYWIGTLNGCHGYCEISDVRLTGCDTLSDNEKEELKELLKKGVIL